MEACERVKVEEIYGLLQKIGRREGLAGVGMKIASIEFKGNFARV